MEEQYALLLPFLLFLVFLLFLSPLALPLPGMLGSTELDVNDRQALVNAAARSGVAVEMVGPKVRVCVCVSVRAWACLCVEMPVFVAAHTGCLN